MREGMPIVPGTSNTTKLTIMKEDRGPRQRREQQRKDDAKDQLTCARPGHQRALLQAGVEIAHGRRQDQERRRHQRETLDEDHAAERIDVERRRAEAERVHQQGVDHAGARAQQDDPADRQQERRRRHRQDHQRAHQRGCGQVGALDQPGQRAAQHQRDRGGAGGELQRGSDQAARTAGPNRSRSHARG